VLDVLPYTDGGGEPDGASHDDLRDSVACRHPMAAARFSTGEVAVQAGRHEWRPGRDGPDSSSTAPLLLGKSSQINDDINIKHKHLRGKLNTTFLGFVAASIHAKAIQQEHLAKLWVARKQ
jgi:hypothetical protein